MTKICTTCSFFETFAKGQDEPHGMGCREPGWAGYVSDPGKPPCGGIGHITRDVAGRIERRLHEAYERAAGRQVGHG